MPDKFIKMYTDFIFLEDEEVSGKDQTEAHYHGDIIMIPGNSSPCMAERAALLYRLGMAPYVLPSGKFSKGRDFFEGPSEKRDTYSGCYETEWEMMRDVLIKGGVPELAILRENQATFTYENAIFSRRVTDSKGFSIKNAILCCQAYHARRALLYYQLLYPETEFKISAVDTGINRANWFLTKMGIETVLGEVERCGAQFHKIMFDLLIDSK